MTKPAPAAVTPVIAAAAARRFCRMRHPSTNARQRLPLPHRLRLQAPQRKQDGLQPLLVGPRLPRPYHRRSRTARLDDLRRPGRQGSYNRPDRQRTFQPEACHRLGTRFRTAQTWRENLVRADDHDHPYAEVASNGFHIPEPSEYASGLHEHVQESRNRQTELYEPGTSSKCQNGHFRGIDAPIPTDYQGCAGEGNSPSTTLFSWANYSADQSALAMTGLTTRPRRPQAKRPRPRGCGYERSE